MRKLNIAILIGALVAVLGAALVFSYGRSVDERIADGRETVAVLVASKPLTAGLLAQALPGSVEVKQVPRAYLPGDALTQLKDVLDKELLGPVSPGGVLSISQFGSRQGADVVRPGKGKVALALSVGITPGVARYVGAGSAVDVFVTYAGGGADSSSAGRTKLFHSGAKVLSITVAPPVAAPQAEDGTAAPAAGAGVEGQVVTVLEVTPQEAERLVNAGTLGQLYLALSNAGEKHTTPDGVVADDVVRSNT